MSTLVSAQPTNRPGLGRLLLAGVGGGVVAAVVNTALLLLGKAVGVGFLMPIGGPDAPLQAIQPTNVFILCLVPAVGAALLLALLGRFTSNPMRIFMPIAGVFLLVSLIPDWALQTDGIATRLVLSAMHVIAAGIIVGALRRTS